MEGEQTPGQQQAMEINLNLELSKLYGILHRELPIRLEHANNIHPVPLYKGSRAEIGSQEEIFDPIGQAPVNNAMGYWCSTRLFYDKHGKTIRKVPVGRGSWDGRGKNPKNSSDGQKWCTQKLKYNNGAHMFTMTEYSLLGENDKPEYAICQIFRQTAPAQDSARDTHPPGVQRDPPRNQVVLPDNSTHQGGTVGEPNEIDQGSRSGTKNKAIGEPEAHPPSMTSPPSDQNDDEHAKPNKRLRYDIEDPSGTKWTIENEEIAKILKKFVEFRRHHQSTLLFRDPSDGSQWSTDDGEITEFLKWFKYPKDQSTHEIPQSNAAPPDMRIEDNPSTSRVQASPHGAAGTSNESATHQVPNLSHQSYMPTQEGLHANNQDYQRSVIPGTTLHPEPELDLQLNDILESQQYFELLNMDIEDNQPGLQFPEPFYPPDESSTHYNQGFSIDDVNTSKPDLDG